LVVKGAVGIDGHIGGVINAGDMMPVAIVDVPGPANSDGGGAIHHKTNAARARIDADLIAIVAFAHHPVPVISVPYAFDP